MILGTLQWPKLPMLLDELDDDPLELELATDVDVAELDSAVAVTVMNAVDVMAGPHAASSLFV